ncbi:MAG: formylglycine-generating enzyme family protein [Thermodesulfobacteriota bacterium]
MLVKGGCFKMGDSFGDGFRSEKPVHDVCVDSFYIERYEVTQHEWYVVMDETPSFFNRCSDCPVESVIWKETQEFVRRLNNLTGMKYRLPTEAEWEYAARSGGRRERWAGTSSKEELGVYAWYEDNASKKTHPVGEKRANGIGLYDMSGNVNEWVQDWYAKDYYSNTPRDNPRGPSSGEDKVLRGGSFGIAKLARTANRNFFFAEHSLKYFGLRLALSAQE